MTTTPTTTTRDQVTSRNLLDHLKKHVPFTYALLLTSVPRGDLQVAQPTNVAEPMLRAYNEGLHAEDRLTWQAIFRNQVLTPADLWEGDGYHQSAFYQQLLQPMGLVYALAAPLASPVLDGYPVPSCCSACRTTASSPPPTPRSSRSSSASSTSSRPSPAPAAGPAPAARGRSCSTARRPTCSSWTLIRASCFPPEAEESIDPGLRNQMLEQAKRFAQTMNGHTTHADRLQLADSHGDQWPFRVVSHKHYPALGTARSPSSACSPTASSGAASARRTSGPTRSSPG